jgi:hypothetical protein
MVNAEFLKSVPTHQGLPLPRATLPDRDAVPHLSPCAHDPKLTETHEIGLTSGCIRMMSGKVKAFSFWERHGTNST